MTKLIEVCHAHTTITHVQQLFKAKAKGRIPCYQGYLELTVEQVQKDEWTSVFGVTQQALQNKKGELAKSKRVLQ